MYGGPGMVLWLAGGLRMVQLNLWDEQPATKEEIIEVLNAILERMEANDE